MMPHITATAVTLLLYLFLGIAYYGWGRFTELFLGLAHNRPESRIIPIWLGWAFTLFIFQVLHFFLPITIYVSAPVLVFGVIFALTRIRNDSRQFPAQQSSPIIFIVVGIVFLGIAVWIASRAMLPPTNYDSGLYHFNAIRWINTYPVIPGLGNLHGRLAFNSSFFYYVAELNFFPIFGNGRSLANSFLLLLILATVLPSIISIIQRPSLLNKERPFRYVSDIFSLPIITYFALSSSGIASPSPDLAASILQLVIFVMLSRGIAEWIDNQKDQNYRIMVLVVLATTAITIKLSNIAFSTIIIVLALVYTWQTTHTHIKAVARILFPSTILIFVWGLRGIILSGAPLYPSTIGYMHMDWAVPIKEVVNEANWVYSWARMPRTTQLENVLGSWAWLDSWLLRISSNQNLIDVVYPLILTTVFCILTMFAGRLNKSARVHPLELIIFLPIIVALIFWFFTAPDPRFAHSIFFLVSISSILLFLSSIQGIIRKPIFITLICLTFLVGNIHFVGYFFHPKCIKSVSNSGWYTVKEVVLARKITLSGLTVYTPKTGDQCWDSPLPSTPYFKDQLRLRVPGKISSGFTVMGQKKVEYGGH